MNMERWQIQIHGQVQGVGFRPHVYRIAKELNLSGWVQNNANGVVIEIQGTTVTHFISKLTAQLPSLAQIDKIETQSISLETDENQFTIAESRPGDITTNISPDASICHDCLDELFDPKSRFYHYPFLNCTQCGPRLSITRNLPYDRSKTSMDRFTFCVACKENYEDPLNRRYHAQPTACSKCGPQLSLSINEIAKHIKAGKIIAIKGLGGYQIICDASNEQTVLILRQRKNRIAKPFAVMSLNIKSAKNLVAMNLEEEKELTYWTRPIVLMKKINEKALPESIAPGLSHLGVMLPYTPLHYLLFNYLADNPNDCEWLDKESQHTLIVTSANQGGNPLIINDEVAQHELASIADIIVSYNRQIVTRLDDSVLRVINKKSFFIRRARGFVPTSIQLAYPIPSTLALGSYLKNTFCITRGNEAFVSQHVGDLKNPTTIEFFHDTLTKMLRFLDAKPERIAHDLHPDFYTTKFAQQFNLPHFEIQHHHAHLASVAAEHQIEQPALGLALDGYGYGENGEAWGGELFLLEKNCYQRLGHLQPLPLPGGDKAAEEPWRMACAVLHLLGRHDEIRKRYSNRGHIELLIQMLKKSIHCPLTTSCGRLFDAASALLGFQDISSYESHAAMRLESMATNLSILPNGWIIDENIFSLLPTLGQLLNCNPVEGANLFHGTLVAGLAEWVERWAQKTKVKNVLMSGGCFLNQILANGLSTALLVKNLVPLLPKVLPPNDGGISLGQAWIAGRSELCA